MTVRLRVELEREDDGRWVADVVELGALAYGATREEAARNAEALALKVIAERVANHEDILTGHPTREALMPLSLEILQPALAR